MVLAVSRTRRPSPHGFPGRLACALTVLAAAACRGGGGVDTGMAPAGLSPVDWSAISQVRPEVAPGAPVLTIAPFRGSIPDSVGVIASELVLARFLHRTDVQVVERRRFTRAVDRIRRGLPAPDGAPEPGVTPSAGWRVATTVASVPGGNARLTVQLVETATNRVAEARDVEAGSDRGVLEVSRVAGDLLLEMLAGLELLPEDAPPPEPWARADGVNRAEEATRLFALGVAAEDRWDWEASGSAYRTALAVGGPGFTEAAQALARVARLRAGGTLGQS